MSAEPAPSASAPEDLEAAADQAIAAWDVDPQEAVTALLVAVDFLEAEADELRAAMSKAVGMSRSAAARSD
ncbi:hypothetical protein [Bradyrhizobium sp. BR 1432]|uniref:hypothetical protein n=1 Tax=Bradyrhizobium sp. BR 1432 TaxID=3447966 RepID=UPI003EE52FC3